MLTDKTVSDTIEYKHHSVRFELVYGFNPPEAEGKFLPVWYVQAHVDGFRKPFQSRFMESYFYRKARQEADEIDNPQDYLNTFVKLVKGEREVKAELLDVTLDSVSLMWYSDGKIEVEEIPELVVVVKNTLDLLYGDQRVEVRQRLTESGWL